jgi:hypothetical protein
LSKDILLLEDTTKDFLDQEKNLSENPLLKGGILENFLKEILILIEKYFSSQNNKIKRFDYFLF